MENLVKDTKEDSNIFSSLKDKVFFVTGHTGFKGTWLLNILNCIGAKTTGFALEADSSSMYNYTQWPTNSHKSIIGDIRDKNRLVSAVVNEYPDVIVHLAAQPLVLDSYDDPSYTYEVNTIGTLNILEAARSLDKEVIVICITTDKVYENQEWVYPYRENDKLGGFDPYSSSKACAELICASYHTSYFKNNPTKKLATARAGNVIGGGDCANNRLIPDIFKAINSQEVITIRNPTAVRPWQHVLEALHGYLLLAVHLLENKHQSFTSFNFGPSYSDTLSVEEVVQKVIKVYGEGSYQVLKDIKAPHEANMLKLDSAKAINTLRWNYRWDADKAIRKTIEWQKLVIGGLPVYDVTQQQISEFYQ